MSPYKVINSTLLAHIYLIVELPAENHVSYKKSLRGKIMLEQLESRVGQYGFYTASGISHRVGHLMPALCETQLHKK